LSNEEDK
jgi:hypothetical protein